MSTQGSYQSSVIRGKDLRSQLIARKQYLENYINSSFNPTNGPPTVASTTDDGHPFATFKIDSQTSRGKVFYRRGLPGGYDWDACATRGSLPYPDLTDPFGAGIRVGTTSARSKHTYFAWPSHLWCGGLNVPVAQQIVPNSLKQTMGSGLIANTNPTASKADLAVTILELLTGNLPRILARMGDNLTRIAIDWKLQTGKELSKHTNPGNEWLSYHFGWAPLVKDVMDAVGILYKLHILLYESEESRRHRGGDLGTVGRITNTYDSGQLGFGSPIETNNFTPTVMKDRQGPIPTGIGMPLRTECTVSQSVLIEADFRFAAKFHRGARPSSRERGHLDKAIELLGLEITPATLWNLAPWTWLLDWFSNIGTVAQNLSDLDWSNVLLDYAYLTFVVKSTATTSVTLPPSWGGGAYTSSSPFIGTTVVTTEKIREQASPYGFSVGWTGLNPFQLSILAALGMTRGR